MMYLEDSNLEINKINFQFIHGFNLLIEINVRKFALTFESSNQ